jgi:hypothetical protein
MFCRVATLVALFTATESRALRIRGGLRRRYRLQRALMGNAVPNALVGSHAPSTGWGLDVLKGANDNRRQNRTFPDKTGHFSPISKDLQRPPLQRELTGTPPERLSFSLIQTIDSRADQTGATAKNASPQRLFGHGIRHARINRTSGDARVPRCRTGARVKRAISTLNSQTFPQKWLATKMSIQRPPKTLSFSIIARTGNFSGPRPLTPASFRSFVVTSNPYSLTPNPWRSE